jgi:HEAT repeat protein
MRDRLFLLALVTGLAWASPALAQDAPPDIPGLIVNLKTGDPATRASSARVLGELGAVSKDAVPGLTEAAKDENKDVRKNAVKALGQIGPASAPAVPAIVSALDDSNWELRKNAVIALGQIGDFSAEKALKKAKSDPNDKVRAAAKRSLKQLKKPKK